MPSSHWTDEYSIGAPNMDIDQWCWIESDDFNDGSNDQNDGFKRDISFDHPHFADYGNLPLTLFSYEGERSILPCDGTYQKGFLDSMAMIEYALNIWRPIVVSAL